MSCSSSWPNPPVSLSRLARVPFGFGSAVWEMSLIFYSVFQSVAFLICKCSFILPGGAHSFRDRAGPAAGGGEGWAGFAEAAWERGPRLRVGIPALPLTRVCWLGTLYSPSPLSDAFLVEGEEQGGFSQDRVSGWTERTWRRGRCARHGGGLLPHSAELRPCLGALCWRLLSLARSSPCVSSHV